MNVSTILLTGFGPFPGVPENASGLLVTRLADAARRRFRERRFVSAVLDTRWDTAPTRIAELYARERPILALHFGVSERAKGFVIETVAQNVCRPSPDAAGAMPVSSCLCETAPGVLAARLPVDRIRSRLEGLGLPVSLSEDAGGYLCNAVLFQALMLAQTCEPAPATGFIHIPAHIAQPGEPGLDWDQALTGALEILCTSLDHARDR